MGSVEGGHSKKLVPLNTNMDHPSNMTVSDVSSSLGLLFYIVSPASTSYREVAEVPDFVGLATPWMVVLILIEGLVNHFHRKKEQNLADSLTSISFGMLMTLAGLASKFIMIDLYDNVHKNYQLVDLRWDSPITWLGTAIFLDLGYYAFHRASHEVAFLWSVHQVHHSSQYFNLTTAFRQPMLEGLAWLTHWFYLPLALAIPTPMMLVHSELNFLYQFWIHTELVGDLGSLGLLFNLPSHHRVHHGANRYCLDKNYGGFLSIWDRIFGTFQDEIPEEEIAYGLVDQPCFFDIVAHTTFYFGLIRDKANSCSSIIDSLCAWLYGPGWFPDLGLPRLGDTSAVEKVPKRPIHTSSLPLPGQLVLALQVLAVVAVHDHLTVTWSELGSQECFMLVAYVVFTLVSVGLQLDRSGWAFAFETFRVLACVSFLLTTLMLSGTWLDATTTLTSASNSILLLSTLLPALASAAYYRNKCDD